MHRIVVHHRVQLLIWVGPGNLLQEHQERLAPVPRLAGCGDMTRGKLQVREQGRDPVPGVNVGPGRRLAWLHREIRAVRTKACIWSFPSTYSTMAFSGGAR